MYKNIHNLRIQITHTKPQYDNILTSNMIKF